MIQIKRKFLSVLPVNEYWFIYPGGFWRLAGLNVYNHLRKDISSPLLVKAANHTVELDLGRSEEEIFGSFSSTFRTHIRAAEKSGVKCYFDNDIDKFVKFYNDFAATKGLPAESASRLKGYGDSFRICYAELDGEVLAAHSFIVDHDQKIARLMQSASRRFDESFDKNKIGKANKYLHFWDMKEFREMGILSYDFGGYMETHSEKVIDSLLDFKLNFGAQQKTTANYYTLGYYVLRQLAIRLKMLNK